MQLLSRPGLLVTGIPNRPPDELAQDIEFLNTEREKTNVLLKDYEDKITFLKLCTDDMHTKIAELEAKLNEMDKR